MTLSPANLKRLTQFIAYQNQFQLTLGKTVAWGSISLVAITALVVVLRYGFDTGSIALQEAVMYNHALLFMLGIAYTYQQDKHVRVDIFTLTVRHVTRPG
ncbi:TRAP transporter small permease subunit [Thiomicrorhabdus aquaedulcis]|uniref:TRAP transporter small permease subunit n=1 Tax=Thiomicrorhabdus aquaedulcis TaxID=2211106 RepID=UPI0022B2A59B|nr:TRAP transporter small permease subunit [Thiomicrorhabdus aquaedulcis]